MIAALGLAACSGAGSQEQVFALLDRSGQPVALASQSQVGNLARGSMVTARVEGREQTLMVGDAMGMRPMTGISAPMATMGMQAPSPAPAVMAAPLPPAEAATRPARRLRLARSAAQPSGSDATGATPTGRARLPTSRAVSRSVM